MVWKPGNPVRIGLPQVEPFVANCFSDLYRGQTLRVAEIPVRHNCLKPGIDVELTRELCGLKNLDCRLSLLEHYDWGGNSTGEWTGFIRQLMDDEYDTGSMSFNPTAARLSVADFSQSVLSSSVYIATRRDEEQSDQAPNSLFVSEAPVPGFVAYWTVTHHQMYSTRYVSDISLAAAVRDFPDCQLDGVLVSSDWSSYPFPKGSPLRDIYNDGLRLLGQTGILSKLYKEYVGNVIVDMQLCFKTTVAYKPMSFWHYVGLFVAFAIGIALAVIAIAVEFCGRRKVKWVRSRTLTAATPVSIHLENNSNTLINVQNPGHGKILDLSTNTNIRRRNIINPTDGFVRIRAFSESL